jgi:hypothetical protein
MSRFIAVISMCFLAASAFPAYSATAERVAVEAGVRAEVGKDLALPYQPTYGLEDRVCLDGRPVKGFQGEIAEYWANLEWCAV